MMENQPHPFRSSSPSISDGLDEQNARSIPAVSRGQSTVEYALVLLGAAAIALLVVSWVTGTDVVGRLFDAVFGHIIRGVR